MTASLTEARCALAETKETGKDSFPGRLNPFFLRCLFLGGWLLIVLLNPAPARAGQLITLPGHLPPPDALTQPLGQLPPTNILHLALNLPLHNQVGLTNLLQQLYDPASPAFHHFLTPQQFNAAFRPTEQDYQAVLNFAKASGLTIVGTPSNRALVEVRGSVANVQNAFHVHLRRFQHPAEPRTFYAPDVEPTVDSSIPIAFIAGLNDYQIPHPASLHLARFTPAQNPVPNNGSEGGYYVGQDFRGAYAPGVTNTGTGQSIGLVEFDSYYPADISDYLALPQAGLTNVSVTLSNVVLGGLTGSPGSGNTEVDLDIDMAISMAPGLSTIYVYEATNDSASPDLVLNRMVSDNLSRQLSCSWNGFDDATVENDFLEFDAQGQSFFQSSGDSGAYTAFRRHNPNPVAAPSDNPNISIVGGTTLNTTGPDGNWVSETTWSWFTSPFNGLSNSATSGGISPTWDIPSWQQGINMTTNQGSTSFRNLPDVAMVANYYFLYGDNGSQLVGGGTSGATPLWAAFTALVNQQRAAQAQSPEGFLNPALYRIATGPAYTSCFHDITVGNNTNRYESTNYLAVPGYDLCTGWGSPTGPNLINTLAPEPLLITPAAGFVSSGPYGGPFTVTNQTFTLTNDATESFGWSFGVNSPWLSASTTNGTLAAGGAAAVVNVSLNAVAAGLTVGAYTNTVWFTNLNDGFVQSQSVILAISPAIPALDWPNPAAITYGAALTSTQLNATANVPGAFTYNPPAGTTLYAGSNPLTVIFTPADSTDYSTVTDTVTLTVSPASLTATAADTNRLYDQPNPVFQGTLTGLQNGDNITATYSCSAVTNSQVGTYVIVPILNDPANLETNYTVTLTDGSLTVEPAPVTITWPGPPSITAGTALSSNQLDATASVSGAFAYNPGLGTVLNQGTNLLTVVFTPADSLDYDSATDTVALVVTAAASSDGSDTPLLPAWASAVLLLAFATLGATFLLRHEKNGPNRQPPN